MAASSFLDTIFGRRKKKSTHFITVFEFDYDTIKAATNNFSVPVGRGGFGSVYKGMLQSGQEIAIKRFSGTFERNEGKFDKEIIILSKLKHNNLINLLGFCSKRDQHFLVYEFMPNSSLDRFIFDPQRASQLNWETCRNIVQGIARGLCYLHEESGLCVVHRDINPTNILLDSDLKPKIAGFGLARLMRDGGENEAESTEYYGTIGYIDPDYFRTGRVSFKSDVYSFGVTILEIISRRRPIIHSEEERLITYVQRCWNRGEAINVIHEMMRQEEREDSISEILRYIHIALLCIDENAETRPSIDKVLHWFSCFSTPLPEPTTGDPFLAQAETNRSLSPSPSLSPGHSSVISMSSGYGD